MGIPVHEEIERVIDQAALQSEFIDAMDSKRENNWIIQCLNGQLYVLLEALPDQALLALVTYVEIPEDTEPPWKTLMNFNAIVVETDATFTGLEPDDETISLRRLITLRGLSAVDVGAAVESIARQTLLVKTLVSAGAALDENDNGDEPADLAPSNDDKDADRVVFRG